MAAQLPERIAPARGAEAIRFPWAHASNVVAALNAVSATLTSHLEARPLMTATLADWRGVYRADFDVVHGHLCTTATALVEATALRASAVVTAAEGANEGQFVANRNALFVLFDAAVASDGASR
jgi:V8-like Glu-specific endopeptidase